MKEEKCEIEPALASMGSHEISGVESTAGDDENG